MKMLQTGDKCPICGQPIKTTDPNKLIFLSAIGWYQTTIEAPNGSSDYCGGNGGTDATNADKLRSLPEDDFAGLTMCPEGIGDSAPMCRKLTRDTSAPQVSCTTCVKNWAKLPYTGWEA